MNFFSRVAIRDLKRIESISRSPIFGCVSATIQGLPTIRAFEKENEYISQFSKIFDENSTAMFLSYNAMRWMATRLDSISSNKFVTGTLARRIIPLRVLHVLRGAQLKVHHSVVNLRELIFASKIHKKRSYNTFFFF